MANTEITPQNLKINFMPQEIYDSLTEEKNDELYLVEYEEDPIVDSFISEDGLNQYIVYASGLCEQYITIPNGGTSLTINLIIEMRDTNYYVSCSSFYPDTSGISWGSNMVSGKTTESITFYNSSYSGRYIYIRGYTNVQ